ncbi:glutathione peroxidase [Polyangium sp. y55x31]|nr:glutathione peroxidase [Polyangium sp. y55x31]MDI1483309.1 glutathione peroxidase [Polyangium sp. y55x31]
MMSLRVGSVVFAAVVGGAALVGCEGGSQPPASPKAGADPAGGAAVQEGTKMSLHDFKMKTIFGEERSLGDFRGKVALVVNVASECGYTPQYAGLERLHERFEAKGFAVLGFPSNDYGAQEPGTDAEIATFCTSKYGVKFPMFSKITVKGSGKHPLYAFLTQAAPAGEVKWNFEKFLVGKDGVVIGRFPSSVEPEDEKLVQAIEKALGS